MSRTVYKHPDGFTLTSKGNALIAADHDSSAVSLPVCSTVLRELGHALLALAAEQEQKFTLKRAGAFMGRSLINELLAVRGKPQSEASRVIHDKLFALSKLNQLDSATAGFAGAIVNVLEIGIANLPTFKQEGC